MQPLACSPCNRIVSNQANRNVCRHLLCLCCCRDSGWDLLKLRKSDVKTFNRFRWVQNVLLVAMTAAGDELATAAAANFTYGRRFRHVCICAEGSWKLFGQCMQSQQML
jgi:hypothetical protein